MLYIGVIVLLCITLMILLYIVYNYNEWDEDSYYDNIISYVGNATAVILVCFPIMYLYRGYGCDDDIDDRYGRDRRDRRR